MKSVENIETYQTLQNMYLNLPHCQAVGLQFESIENRRPTLSVNWRDDLIGNAQTNVIHGGVVTTLIDVAGAVAVAAHLPEVEGIATLDLRIDYLRAALPNKRIYAISECFRLTGQVAFVHTICHDENSAEIIAAGTATYMCTPMSETMKAKVKQ